MIRAMVSPGRAVTIHSPDEAATAALAARLAPRLRAGDSVLLSGGLGMGKSHFTRALIRARLGDPVAEVPSPTYTLVQVYDDGAAEIWHADLYRLSGEDEIAETGLEDAFEAAICLVEWPERLGGIAPTGALRLDFAPGDDDTGRRLTMTGDPARWRETIEHLADIDVAGA